MPGIERLTQGYDASEDRLFIDVRLTGGAACRLWLTQRLTGVLVQHLCLWLDEQLALTASGHHDARLHRFEQQAAAASLGPERAVEPGGEALLVHSVDLDRGEQALRLSFRAAGARPGDGPQMTLDPVLLRQWLAILRGLYAAAGWPTEVWPDWLGDGTRGDLAGLPMHLH